VRDESDRVAARVRDLLRAHGLEPPGTGEHQPLVPLPRPSRWRQLLDRVPVRVDPGRTGALAVGAAVVVAALITGWWLLSQRPQAVPISSAGAQLSAAPTPVGTEAPTGTPSGPPVSASVSASSSPASAALVVVDVAGRVRRPGLYRLPDGSRVDDAIRRAGGPLRGVDLTSLNLAARVVDGQQIVVGGPVAGGVVPVTGPVASAVTAPVSLNSGTLEQLESLPGVGPVLGQNIIDWRMANGGFSSIDQLTQVTGIGDVRFAQLRPLVTL
jgi:competence protein ComEA